MYSGIVLSMSLYLKQNERKTQLQERLSKELQEKAKRKALEDQELPDGVDDSAFVKNMQQTASLAWVWILASVILIGVIFWIIMSASSGNQ